MRLSVVLILILASLLASSCARSDAVDPGAGQPSPTAVLTPTALPAALPPTVFMGDSITMGAFVSTPEKMFVNQVHAYMESRGMDATNDVRWTLDPRSDLIAAKEIAAQHRRLIFVELGVHWAAFDAVEFRTAYGAMLDCLAGSGARVVVGTIPWLNWRVDTPVYFEMAFYSQIIREEAAKRGVAVADLWAATDQRVDAISRPSDSCFIAPNCHGDNYHPGDLGQTMIAFAYEKALDVALTAQAPKVTGRCELDPIVDALGKGRRIPGR